MTFDLRKYLRHIFSGVIALFLSIINYQFVSVTMNRTVINLTLKGKTKNLIEAYPFFINMVKLIYSPIIFTGAFIVTLMFINFIYIQRPKVEKKEEPKLYPDNIPYDQHADKFDMHLGIIHNERDLEVTANPKLCTITEKNILKNKVVFGVIGEGKTASALLPDLQQAIYYQADNPDKKNGGFITDVKGNFSQYAINYCKDVGRDDDIILFRICGDYYYNFLYKPEEPASIIASRMTEYLKVSNTSGNDSYWIDEAKKAIENGIILARLDTEDGYITFEDLDKTVIEEEERDEILQILQVKYEKGLLTKYERELYLAAKKYYTNIFGNLDHKIRSIIISEVDRVIGAFTNDPLVKHTFCPSKEKLNFPSFRQIIEDGKIFIFDIPKERFSGVATVANAFAKLDYQSMILKRMSNPEYNQDRLAFYLSDENHFITTPNDAEFYSLAREAKNFSMVATQSVSSYLTVLKNENLVNNMLNNLDNKIFMRNTDPKTLDYALKVLGKEVKTYQNRSTSESGKSDIDYLANNVSQDNKSISQSISEIDRKEEIFTQEFFSRILDEFKAVALVNSGKVLAPIHLFKYWENRITRDYPIKKAKVKNEFIFTPYLTTQEMIDKINREDFSPQKEAEEDVPEKEESSLVLSNKDKDDMRQYKDNGDKHQDKLHEEKADMEKPRKRGPKAKGAERVEEKKAKEADKVDDLLDAF